MTIDELREKCAGHTEFPWCVQKLSHCMGSLWLQIGYEKPDGTKWGPVCRINSTGEPMPDGVVAEISSMATSERRQLADAQLLAHAPFLLAEATRLTARVKELEGACKKVVDALGGTCDFKECPQCQAYLACEAALKETEQ